MQFTATASDPGSDDLTFTWEWGDGSPAIARTYYNNGTGPDPYPSPGGTFPFTATDSQVHAYAVAGTYELNLTVRDDDGGSVEISFAIVIGQSKGNHSPLILPLRLSRHYPGLSG